MVGICRQAMMVMMVMMVMMTMNVVLPGEQFRRLKFGDRYFYTHTVSKSLEPFIFIKSFLECVEPTGPAKKLVIILKTFKIVFVMLSDFVKIR